MRFQYFDSLCIKMPRVSAPMMVHHHKVCLIRNVQPMDRFRFSDHSISFSRHGDMCSDKHRSWGNRPEPSCSGRTRRRERERERKKAECFIQLKAGSCSRMELLWISNSDEYGSTETEGGVHLNTRWSVLQRHADGHTYGSVKKRHIKLHKRVVTLNVCRNTHTVMYKWEHTQQDRLLIVSS